MNPTPLNRLEAFVRELEKGWWTSTDFRRVKSLAADLRALLEERKARDGYVLVPRVPTDKMLRVMADQWTSHDDFWNARQAYHSMIAAAQPEHSTQEEEG